MFEVLTGRPPIEAGTVTELISKVSSGATRQALRGGGKRTRTARRHLCPGDGHGPVRRYARATDLADEIQRWIADEPVAAFPDSWPTRMVARRRRHKTAVSSAAALLIASVIGLAIYNVQIGRARAVAVAHAREALKQKGIADLERGRAEANFRRARGAVDEMLTEVGDVELADVPQVEPVRERLLAKAQRFYLEFLDQAKTDPAVRAEAGRGYCRLGDIEELLGDFARSEHAYRQSIALLGDDTSVRAERARAYHGLGVLLKKANRFREAEAALREALRLREQLAAVSPPYPDADQALAQTRYHLGAVAAKLHGRRGEEEAAYARRCGSRRSSLLTPAATPPGAASWRATSTTSASCSAIPAGRATPSAPTARRWRSPRRWPRYHTPPPVIAGNGPRCRTTWAC